MPTPLKGQGSPLAALAHPPIARYSVPAPVKAIGDGFRSLNSKRRISALMTFVGAFFVPAMLCHGGCAWETFRSAGFLLPRSANPRTAATQNRFAAVRGSSYLAKGAAPMTTRHTLSLNPSKIRALAHRRMALAALHANSSLTVRLSRYNAHMAQARALEAQLGGAHHEA